MPDETMKSEPPAPSDPIAATRLAMKPQVRKRFYETAEAVPFEGQFAVALDGKLVFTPAKSRLQLPTRAAAEAVAAEWQAQGAEIDPTSMPLTRIVNAALDGVARNKEAVAAEIVHYAGTDLVCYRAGGPESLVAAQAEAWDPILAFATETMGARFVCVEGIVHIPQPPAALEAVAATLARVTDIGAGTVLALACLNVMTTLTGSALIPLARVGGLLSLEQAWSVAHVDEDFQMKLWGTDAEALARRAQHFNEMEAADRLWQLVQS
jgi:chaperone required for assembly of F1-ATPase